MLTELTRVCPICHALLPDPAATSCDRCGRGTAPSETTWPAVLKWWLLSELQVDSFHAWRTRQDVFEYKLRSALLGVSLTKPNPWGLPISEVTPASELYRHGLDLSGHWKAAGSPIAVRVLAPPTRKSA